MAKQQFRWARGSQYNTLRMMPWMLRHARPLAFFYTVDIVLPFLLLGAYLGWGLRHFVDGDIDLYQGFLWEHGRVRGAVMVGVLAVLGSMASAAVRQARHLRYRPSDLYRIPTYLVISTFMLTPIRMLGFVRMAHASGWGTRGRRLRGGAGPQPRRDHPVPARRRHVRRVRPLSAVSARIGAPTIPSPDETRPGA